MTNLTEGEKYKAFRNFMFNELGISRNDIRDWIIETIQQEAKRVVQEQKTEAKIKEVIDREIRDSVAKALGKTVYGNSKVVENAVSSIIAEKLEIKIK